MDLNLKGMPYPKQIEFFKSTKRYIAYGGSRGGGKSWAARRKAVLLALNYEGMQILILRRTLQELRENHILSLQSELLGVAKFDTQNKEFLFPNNSRIKLGFCAAESDVLQFQGQAYDVIFMEEATQFTEFQKDSLMECNRSSGKMKERFTPRMYFTCNPGGIGHAWVKRLFVDKQYINKENPNNYEFIPSTVYENKYLMDNNPEYVENLENLPELRKRAMLYGDWDAFEGQYYPEWNRSIHVVEAFEIPPYWRRFRSLDYGMDMTACYWWAVDTQGLCYVYRELHESGLILSAAAQRILSLTPNNEIMEYTVCSPDLWNKRQESGESGMEIMSKVGLNGMISANNSRVMGWRTLREYIKPFETDSGEDARIKFFPQCINAIKNIPLLQYDDKSVEDAAGSPHEITHAPESIRYGIMSRPRITIQEVVSKWQKYSREWYAEKSLNRAIKNSKKRSDFV
jgi:phage terminase large subunit